MFVLTTHKIIWRITALTSKNYILNDYNYHAYIKPCIARLSLALFFRYGGPQL